MKKGELYNQLHILLPCRSEEAIKRRLCGMKWEPVHPAHLTRTSQDHTQQIREATHQTSRILHDTQSGVSAEDPPTPKMEESTGPGICSSTLLVSTPEDPPPPPERTPADPPPPMLEEATRLASSSPSQRQALLGAKANALWEEGMTRKELALKLRPLLQPRSTEAIMKR
ncbi:MAG: hypothetical protein ACRC9V_12185, partial [Aeromonas sp.]